MAIPQVNLNSFTIATQVETINEIANLEGDLTTLETDTQANLVDAINEVRASLSGLRRSVLVYSMAMS